MYTAYRLKVCLNCHCRLSLQAAHNRIACNLLVHYNYLRQWMMTMFCSKCIYDDNMYSLLLLIRKNKQDTIGNSSQQWKEKRKEKMYKKLVEKTLIVIAFPRQTKKLFLDEQLNFWITQINLIEESRLQEYLRLSKIASGSIINIQII